MPAVIRQANLGDLMPTPPHTRDALRFNILNIIRSIRTTDSLSGMEMWRFINS